MRALVVSVSLLALAAPLPALAHDRDPEAASAELEARLRDPATQQAMADSVADASEALLDLPLAPLARAIAAASGEDPAYVDPHLTLRDVSPGTADVPAELHRKLPRMMGAMGDMAGGVNAMIPALRQMTERMREAVDRADRAAHDGY